MSSPTQSIVESLSGPDRQIVAIGKSDLQDPSKRWFAGLAEGGRDFSYGPTMESALESALEAAVGSRK